ncbi:MAG: putative glycoside hydrolase [Faecousia sp.]
MALSYRTRRRFRRLWIALLTLVIAAAVFLVCWTLWLDRYVIYTRDGVELNFDLSLEFPEGILAEAPPPPETVDVYYNEGEDAIEPVSTELTQMNGYYITLDMIVADIDAVRAQIAELPEDAAIMLDVRNIKGETYYTSSVSVNTDKYPLEVLDTLIGELKNSKHYLIARMPAFRNYWFGLYNMPNGLQKIDIVALWMDETRCYWLDPTKDGTITHLIQMVLELRMMGFNEVVFYDFRFPDTDQIKFTGDKAAALQEAAKRLVDACTTETFAVSFTSADPSFPLPEGRSRLYLENITAAEIIYLKEKFQYDNEIVRTVFLTDSNDTRYEEYSVLRPLDSDR